MPSFQTDNQTSLLRRTLAYWWYIWGLSICYSANRMVDKGLYASGVRSFQRAIRLWPQFAGAYYRSGLIRGRELGEYNGALIDLGRAILLEPEWADPYLQRGMFQRFQGQSAAALADLQHFVGLAEEGYWKQEALRQIEALRAEQAHE